MIACVRRPDGSFRVRSQTEPSRIYQVSLDPDGCDCKAFTYRRKCAHVQAARDELEALTLAGEVFDAAGYPAVVVALQPRAVPSSDATLDALLGSL